MPLSRARVQTGTDSVNAEPPLGSSAVLGSFVASTSGVAEEARTRGFAAPAFAGCAFVVGLVALSYGVVQGLSSDQRGGSIRVSSGTCADSQATAGSEPAKGHIPV